MSNKQGKNWFRFGWHPSEDEMLLFLDGEASERQADKMRQHLESCWACRNHRDKLDRAIATFMDYCEAEATDATTLPPRANVQFAERLRQAASAQPSPSLLKRWANAMHGQVAERRVAVGAMACLLLVSALALILSRAERQVSAQELLRRTTEAEILGLRRVGEPVVYRKLQVKRLGAAGESVLWESWNDAEHKQFRQRVVDRPGAQFLRTHEKALPPVLTELEQIFRANNLDPQRPLSATAFAAWRNTIKTKTETVATANAELRLTIVTAEPNAVNLIREASLSVRQSDWHTVALHLKVQGEHDIQQYELSETAYEVLPLQALTVFADLTPTPALLAAPTASVAPTIAIPVPSLLPATALPSVAALQAAEVAALYALHQAKADLGEQLEVVREQSRQIVVRGLVQTAARKEEIVQSLSRIALVSARIQTFDEAVQQTKPPNRLTPAPPLAADESLQGVTVTSGQAAVAANPFQQKLIESFGGQQAMSEAERQDVNRKVSKFYNAIEADASAAMSEAWALRRLHERFTQSSNTVLEATSQEQLREMLGDHVAQLRQRSNNLQARLRPLLVAFVGKATALRQPEPAPPAPVLAVFHAVEQVSRLTDQLIDGDGKAATAMQQTARALLADLARLDTALTSIEKELK